MSTVTVLWLHEYHVMAKLTPIAATVAMVNGWYNTNGSIQLYGMAEISEMAVKNIMTVMVIMAVMANGMASNANMDVGQKRPVICLFYILMVSYFFNGKNTFNGCNECNDH